MSNLETMNHGSIALTRRQILAAAAAVPVAMYVGGNAQPAVAQETPSRGGRLMTTMGTGLPTLNPTLSSWLGGFYNLLYDPLVRLRLTDVATNTYEVLPGLAESWEWNDDETEIVFTLRPGVTFHDGSEWNAEVAKWNFDLMMTHEGSFAKPFVESIESVEVVNPMQVRLILNGPSAPLLANLSNSTGRVYFISQAEFERLGEVDFGRQPSGTGPMRLGSWVEENIVSLERFDDYWETAEDGESLPYLDGADYRLIPEAATALAELQAGNLNYLIVEAKDAQIVEADPNLEFAAVPASGAYRGVIGLHQTEGVFGANPLVRKAALHALNREAMVGVLTFGQGSVAPYPYWSEGVIGYDDSLPRYDYDPERAAELMAEAGFADGVDITLTVIQRPLEQQMAEMIKQMWDAVGIRTELEVLERTAWISKLKDTRVFDAAFWSATFPIDPDQNGQLLLTDANSNWGSYSNPEVDRLMAEARATTDLESRVALYREVQLLIYEDACVGQAYYQPDLAANRTSLRGVTYDTKNARFQEAWIAES